MVRTTVTTGVGAVFIVFVLIAGMSIASAQMKANSRPVVSFIEMNPPPLEAVAGWKFSICAKVRDREGDALGIRFRLGRQLPFDVKKAGKNAWCAWFTAPEERGLRVMKIIGYETYMPENNDVLEREICILMNELNGGSDPPSTYCPRI